MPFCDPSPPSVPEAAHHTALVFIILMHILYFYDTLVHQ